MGLEGATPETVDTDKMPLRIADIYSTKKLLLNAECEIFFAPDKHLVFHFGEYLAHHPNGMRFSCYDSKGDLIATNEYFSIGGGFVVNEKFQLRNVYFMEEQVWKQVGEEAGRLSVGQTPETVGLDVDKPTANAEISAITAALPFHDADSLMCVCRDLNLSIAQVVFRNELQWRSAEEITIRTLNLWNVMNQSIANGISSKIEYLPGKLGVRRRAPNLHNKLKKAHKEYTLGSHFPAEIGKGISKEILSITPQRPRKKHLPALDYLSLYAIAVNEENSAGGRVVTAPTNGASGTIPSVLKYYLEFICPSEHQRAHDTVEFLLTCSAIGMLYKRGASISAAEMGCQGEVGVACSMAAAGFAAVMGGSVEQIENAAEIAMEHNLGLTCDPPLGLVVIPCIERNALAAVKAVAAAQLSLNGDGSHRVSLDQVIKTMRQTGIDMMSKYKETSEGGLAVNVPVC